MKIEIVTDAADNPVAEFFSSSSTPETDTFAAHMSEEFIDPSWLKFSQELERERDEARNHRDILRLDAQKEADYHDRMVGELEKVYAERDEWAALCGQYKQERDDAREMLMQYMFDRSGTWINFLPADKPTP